VLNGKVGQSGFAQRRRCEIFVASKSKIINSSVRSGIFPRCRSDGAMEMTGSKPTNIPRLRR
jgi:hypothetical protein